MKKYYTVVRFANRHDARRFALAARKDPGWEVHVTGHDVEVRGARLIDVEGRIRQWALRRRALPQYLYIDY